MIPEVIGIDPALRSTGVCLPNGQCVTIATGEAVRGDVRLHDLRRAFRYYLRAWPAELAVIEVPAQFKSGDAALAAGMAQGIIRELLVEFRIPFGKINPSLVKKFATGLGGGPLTDKAHMVTAANRHRLHSGAAFNGNGYDMLTDDNQADAWHLWQMGRWYLGMKTLDESRDDFLHGTQLRDEVVFKPSKGCRWPSIKRQVA